MNTSYLRTRPLLAKSLLIILLAIPILLLLRPLAIGTAKEKVRKEQSARPQDSEKKSSIADPTDLARRIDKAIDESELAPARWGICVISMSDGSTLYQRNADKLFTPASNMKIYTTGVALDLLGADYRWRTSVYAITQPDANGKLQADLILYGRGAPDLVANSNDGGKGSLSGLADQLYQKGIRR